MLSSVIALILRACRRPLASWSSWYPSSVIALGLTTTSTETHYTSYYAVILSCCGFTTLVYYFGLYPGSNYAIMSMVLDNLTPSCLPATYTFGYYPGSASIWMTFGSMILDLDAVSDRMSKGIVQKREALPEGGLSTIVTGSPRRTNWRLKWFGASIDSPGGLGQLSWIAVGV